jgi:putative flavoprotein involved in K+ transport
MPLLNEAAEPAHHRGVTAFPGLHLIGLRWLTKYKSFFIYGVGEDAERLAGQIAARSG